MFSSIYPHKSNIVLIGSIGDLKDHHEGTISGRAYQFLIQILEKKNRSEHFQL